MYVVTVSCTTRGKHAKDLATKIGLFLKDKATMSQGTEGYKVALYDTEGGAVKPPPAGTEVYLVVKAEVHEAWESVPTVVEP
jgi:hypothetical protein